MKTFTHLGQPSWRFSSDRVEATITRLGGHLAPVRFCLSKGMVQPFSIAPWAEEKLPADTPPILQALRGDFFCAPFGGSGDPKYKEQHPPHGETANASWKFESLRKSKTETQLHLSLKTKVRPGRVDKMIRLRKGETAVYCQHILSGMSGGMNLGHHPTLKFPDAPGSGLISTSPIHFAQTWPTILEDPAIGSYSSLKPAAIFTRLDRVPMANGGVADLSRYPTPRGFEDIVMVVHEAKPDFAWTAVSFPKERYVWFSLKDPRVLRSTVFWMSNGGRHYPPWNGRHISVMGLEDVTSYFACGLVPSIRPNPISKRGIPTSLSLRAAKPLVVNYIMGVAAIPAGFERVKTINLGKGVVTLVSDRKRRVTVPIDTAFLYENPL